MKKKIALTLEDGRIVRIDAHLVAHDRATYYAKEDKENTTYEEEYDYTLGNDDELIDWIQNNMDWHKLPMTIDESQKKPLSECEVEEIEVQG